ncbi:hypothetical protein E0L93_10275 [Rubrobacter taiwanensis]|uniref:DUF948 domain-containing protein n=1 Tax=Rubrobacter taiwanensis TaxID=185139 RepID=A0A4V2NW78_9ACTN|nr:hypothetical protein [Rubrobacter taiwanensis]TCJ16212.1 hypothetical protein E0L93_10275 [Rubrobacter taiwanensis]
MGTMYAILIAVSALAALYTGFLALRAGLRLRRTYRDLMQSVAPDLDRLHRRTQTLQRNADELGRRASELPVQISGLQQSIAQLQFLINTLNESINQLRRALRYTDLKNFGAANFSRIADAFLNPRNR